MLCEMGSKPHRDVTPVLLRSFLLWLVVISVYSTTEYYRSSEWVHRCICLLTQCMNEFVVSILLDIFTPLVVGFLKVF